MSWAAKWDGMGVILALRSKSLDSVNNISYTALKANVQTLGIINNIFNFPPQNNNSLAACSRQIQSNGA